MGKQRKSERARDRGEVRLLTVEIPVALDDALESHRQRDMRTKKALVVMALQEFLTKQGAWPPKEKR